MLSNKFKINYSIGAVANGVKTDTFTFFLLFFYSNIIGLNPGLAGSAIFNSDDYAKTIKSMKDKLQSIK